MNEKIYNLLDELAEQAGCSTVKKRYHEVRNSMQRSIAKQYAILGDVNSGKSTIINILAGEKKLPVSVRGNEHDTIAVVDSNDSGYRWVELASGSYMDNGLADVESPLWHIDAAVYILSATTPFSQQDVYAIKACVAHGVPCTLILSKLDVVDESEIDEIIKYTKAQAEHQFGSDAVIVINTKDEVATKQAIMSAFTSSEDCLDIRDYILAVSYAKTLREAISAQYKVAKDKMQIVADKEKQAKQGLIDEKLEWDRIELEIDARKMALTEKMSVEMNQLYSECISNLTDKAMAASSPKDWWEKSLQKEFHREIAKISNKIDRMICSQVATDRDWIVETVEQKFGSKLSIDAESAETQLDDIVFGVAPEKLGISHKTKNLAMAGLLVSSVALGGVLIYPILAMHSINAIYWKIAGVAVVGTGFWTFIETKKEKSEKQQCLRTEIARYILSSRDDNIEALKKNIRYGYETMKLSIHDMQLSSTNTPVNENDSKVYAEYKAISEINRKCDEIVNSLLSEAE